MKSLSMIILAVLAVAPFAWGQVRVEGGLRYSALFTDITVDGETFHSDATQQFIVPSLRIGFSIPASNWLLFLPFAGYGESGGAGVYTGASGYTRIQAIETGVLGMARIGDISAGLGLRGDIITRAFRSYATSGELPYHRYALAAGVRVDVTILEQIPLGVESWYTITNLHDERSFSYYNSIGSKTEAHTHTIGVFVGYIFDME